MEYTRLNNWEVKNEEIKKQEIDFLYNKCESFVRIYYKVIFNIRHLIKIGDLLANNNQNISFSELNTAFRYISHDVYMNLNDLIDKTYEELKEENIPVPKVFRKFSQILNFIRTGGSTRENRLTVSNKEINDLALKKFKKIYKKPENANELKDLLDALFAYKQISEFVIQKEKYGYYVFAGKAPIVKAKDIDEMISIINSFPSYKNYDELIKLIKEKAIEDIRSDFDNLNFDDKTLKESLSIPAWKEFKNILNNHLGQYYDMNDEVLKVLDIRKETDIKDVKTIDLPDDTQDGEAELATEEEIVNVKEEDYDLSDEYANLDIDNNQENCEDEPVSDEQTEAEDQTFEDVTRGGPSNDDILAKLSGFDNSLTNNGKDTTVVVVDKHDYSTAEETLAAIDAIGRKKPELVQPIPGKKPRWNPNVKKNYAEIANQWFELKKTKNIGKMVTSDLSRKLQRCIDKINEYIKLGEEKTYFYLNYLNGKIFGDSMMMDLFQIIEILDLNTYYKQFYKRPNFIKNLSKNPLLTFYVIGTYLKHSHRPYMSETIDYSAMSQGDIYDLEFKKYIDWELDMQKVILDNPLFSMVRKEKMACQLRTIFGNTYKNWYDYLYVRYFNRPESEVETIKAVNKGNELTEKQTKKANSLNETKKFYLIKLLKFFEYMKNTIDSEPKTSILDTKLYKSRYSIYTCFEQHWNEIYDPKTKQFKDSKISMTNDDLKMADEQDFKHILSSISKKEKDNKE